MTTLRKIMLSVVALLFTGVLAAARQQNISDEGGRVLALEKAWNLALEEKNANALDMLLANTMVSIDIDGSISSRSEFLASIKSPAYQPSQAVTEQSTVQVYGDTAVVVGIFRVKGTEKGKPYVHRERFVDTWIKINGTWQCVVTTSTLITAK
jgi:ketosteroid isomerase-like protein